MNSTFDWLSKHALLPTLCLSATIASSDATASEAQSARDAPRLVASSGQTAAQPLRLLVGGEALELWGHPAIVRIGPLDGSTAADDAANEESDDPATCLTQAVYYEARSESLAGQQAVAQVVINRTRLSPFPSSICGVVFQRTRETSGCQFSFACDGSMDRSMDWAAWERAGAVARHALAGFVFKPMKEATHYHAAWMTPYWSTHLARIRQIGGQVFYR